MKIRKIEEKDKSIYLEMARDFYASPAVLSNIPEENLTSSFREFTSGTPFGDAFIFEKEGNVIGYGVLAYTYSQEAGGKTVWLEEIYIKEAYRGKGAGSLFIDFVLENIPAKRYRLETEPENEKAAALYRRKGFEFFEYVNYRLDR
ncbi:MAG: GNAT family N-acetyltransferase [Clostridia bacterium]|nr:GNAT family N-acetyltransferase [Clostridia bacterium]